MKVSKEQAQQNRQALLDAAGALFKTHGVDGVGVADVCRQAGLTQGALYKHFTDKQDLAAQAFAHAFRAGSDRADGQAPGGRRDIDTYLRRYLSPAVRDDLGEGCPLVATACETARQGEAMSRSFSDAFLELRSGIARALPMGEDEQTDDRTATASLVVAALVGAMAIARGVDKADRQLSDEVLQQVHGLLQHLTGATR